MFDATTSNARRADWLGVLARADLAALRALLADAPALPEYARLRGPEAGMSMIRGRMGGGGDVFNLGEMTMCRCSVRDAADRVGHGYAAGRDLAKVELVARLDAALQDGGLYPEYEAAVLRPLMTMEAERRAAIAARAAATEVKFFTLSAMRS